MAMLQVALQKSAAVRVLEQPRQSVRALLGSNKSCQPKVDAIMRSDCQTGESFTHLKLTAEKMVQEQACVKADLQIAKAKLQKSEEQIRSLESKLRDISNENAMLKVKQNEDMKLWKGLDSKVLSTRTYFDQITDTLNDLENQVQQAESTKKFFEEKMEERAKFYEGIKGKIDDLSLKRNEAEKDAQRWKTEATELRKEFDSLKDSYTRELAEAEKMSSRKEELERELKHVEHSNKDASATIELLQNELESKQRDLAQKTHEFAALNNVYIVLLQSKAEMDIRTQDLENCLDSATKANKNLEEQNSLLTMKISELEKANALAASNTERLLTEVANCNAWAKEERQAKEAILSELKELTSQFQEQYHLKKNLEEKVEEAGRKVQELQCTIKAKDDDYAERSRAVEAEITSYERKLAEASTEKERLQNVTHDLEEKAFNLSKHVDNLELNKDNLVKKISQMEADHLRNVESAKEEIQQNKDEIVRLVQMDLENAEKLRLCEAELNQLREERLEISSSNDELMAKRKLLEVKNLELETKLASAEKITTDIRKQSQLQLESKQAELTKHLKEISQRNNQEMNDMRRKYEIETKDAVLEEQQRAESSLEIFKQECEQQLAKEHEASAEKLRVLQLEHEKLIIRTKDDFEEERKLLKLKYEEDLQKVQKELHSELTKQRENGSKELEIKIRALQNQRQTEINELKSQQESYLLETSKDHEMRLKILEDQHEQTILKIQESHQKDLDEYKEKLLLWKAKVETAETGDVLSNIEKCKESEQDHIPLVTQNTQVNKLRSRKDKARTNTLRNVPTHSTKVTQHEYEVATSDGKKTITKRKRTKSTVMYEEKSDGASVDITERNSKKRSKSTLKGQRKKQLDSHGTLKELFGGGCLDPYNGDPYAFD
ncbi:hypothetical protein O6H91_05G125700 [Diphasiastrum complanatum]|uniref:Uncharacterized protein n=1 Tax=Diphasiastrum complanatum TaxID=34168 RepID=A0ACC2DT36_DIPCM|nr:hypothetical protein O6H91_05G125700 [Diphasiastrum complanatum]